LSFRFREDRERRIRFISYQLNPDCYDDEPCAKTISSRQTGNVDFIRKKPLPARL
jgi:hypothetical protein